jgi:bifunctional aspartokinase / homoserine dehydrogenase 1
MFFNVMRTLQRTLEAILNCSRVIQCSFDTAFVCTQVVVVSAMGSHPTSPVKVTDLLLNMVDKASQQDEGFLLDLASLQEKHVVTAKALLGEGKLLNDFVSRLLDDISNLKSMLRAMAIGAALSWSRHPEPSLLQIDAFWSGSQMKASALRPLAAGMATESFSDYVVGHGELWCAQLFAATCQKLGGDAIFMDTRDVLVVTPTSDGNAVDVQYEASNAKLDSWADNHGVPKIIVSTGFIAKNPQVCPSDSAALSYGKEHEGTVPAKHPAPLLPACPAACCQQLFQRATKV